MQHDTTISAALAVTAETIAEAHKMRVRDQQSVVDNLLRLASRWPREWTAAQAFRLQLAQEDLARAKDDALKAGLDWLEAKIDALPDGLGEKERTA